MYDQGYGQGHAVQRFGGRSAGSEAWRTQKCGPAFDEEHIQADTTRRKWWSVGEWTPNGGEEFAFQIVHIEGGVNIAVFMSGHLQRSFDWWSTGTIGGTNINLRWRCSSIDFASRDMTAYWCADPVPIKFDSGFRGSLWWRYQGIQPKAARVNCR